ncbi:SRPBCC family protein [Phycicoccus sp. CSK15P-2]|uniref:SRPBCC family protein n=1 Tax=Phycicoccus sp. CSK15P-2 TaxID=2807627 RepID=UPI0019527EA4|nr:SRPBCC family protein [Phycicoccus sp. CSK15P-2]MBM6403652.1 SRPBCC family protein [Phycicoccus sp. CSK15P-2]MBM6405117.1 SRPBCC family protein [Phycicoccus sp. CSK15P-2]
MPSRDVVSVQRLIPAAPEPIFDLLVDPAGHTRIDGGGSVRGARSGGRRLTLGDRFGMDMKIGAPYSTSNTVIEYEANRRIAWQTLAGGVLSRFVGGRIWRYELEPVDGGTLVTESWDISQEAAFSKPAVRRMEGMTRRNMASTLERIDELVTGG